ncbi:MAG: GDSL-type esterase/lipase family protein [Thermoplasmatota archaeon]
MRISRLALPLALFVCGCAVPTPPESSAAPIVAFGDSYTEGHGASPSEAYPALLARDLNETALARSTSSRFAVLNRGVTGETALEALPRMKRDVLDAHPRLVIVEFGVNEAFRGYPVAVALDGLDRICQNASAAGIPIVLVGVHFANYSKNFDDALASLSEKYRTGLVLDVLDGVLGNASLTSDEYHPNAKGYALMEQRILPVVREMIARSS